MNRTDRLLAIVLELQGKRMQRAEDLAATFETSKRTIYRDILALCEAGIPVISVPGQGYSLMQGFFLPPIRFTADEAAMLLLGGDVMVQNFDSEYRMAAESASRKIAGVLPESLQDEVEVLRDSIRFIARGALGTADEAERLQQLRRAIIKRQTVRFNYQARYGESADDPPLAREADPYALIHVGGTWQLIAYCHLRHDIRSFRLSRMDSLIVSVQYFKRMHDFTMQTYMQGKQEPAQIDTIAVRVLFDDESARWVREGGERHLFFVVAEAETPDGLLLTLRIRHENEIVQWLLGWGRHIRVLEPQSLRDRLALEGQAIIDNHRDSK